MPRRMSNRERIQRQAMEAEARERERKEQEAASAAAPKRRGSRKVEKKKTTRLKMVWIVFDDRLNEVATFPYPEKEAAQEEAAALTEKTGKEHFINPIKVPMDDE